MTHTTPRKARELANASLVYIEARTKAREALHDLADQVEALTAELSNIANTNLKTWDKDYNTPADFMAWAQSRARAAIKGAAT